MAWLQNKDSNETMVGPGRVGVRLSTARLHFAVQQEQLLQRKEEEQWIRRPSYKEKRKIFPLKIQLLTGRVFEVSVSPDDTIEELAEKIEMKEGINPDQQQLFFQGIKLHFDGTIDEYHIVSECNGKNCGSILGDKRRRKDAVVFLTLRNRGG